MFIKLLHTSSPAISDPIQPLGLMKLQEVMSCSGLDEEQLSIAKRL